MAITSGIFYCRDSAKMKAVARFKLHRGLIVKCSVIGNKNISPSVKNYLIDLCRNLLI
jgi:hypothetical protein